MPYIYTQAPYDSALPLLWDGSPSSRAADPAWAPFTDPSLGNVGLNAKYSSIGQFAEISGCRINGNRVEQPIINSYSATLIIGQTGGTRFVTSKAVEAFRITLSLPGLYSIDKRTGYEPQAVSIGIYYRIHDLEDPNNVTNPWRVLVADYVISGKQRAEILKTIESGNLKSYGFITGPEILDILVVRNSPSNAGNMNITDDVFVKEITEITYAELAYNNTALLGVKIRATDQLSGQPPAVSSLVKGTKIAVPTNHASVVRYDPVTGNYNAAAVLNAYTAGWLDGKLTWDEATRTGTKVWSDNPVWCLYDLLTNNRYGLGTYYRINPDKIGLMRAHFYLMAKYCDEPIQYVDTSGATDVLKYRPRFSLNIVIDQTKAAMEWVSQICSIMRASAYYSEGIFWIDIDKPKLPTQIFNMSNIKDYSQAGTSFKQIPNCLEVQYVNPLQNYEIDTFRMESDALQTDPTIEERKKALMLIGITNFDQAKSLAKYTLLAGQWRSKLVSFKTNIEAVRCMVTDVIGIQHDVPRNGSGGKIIDIAAGIATLSDYVTFLPTIDYFVTLSNLNGMSTKVQIYPTITEEPTNIINIPALEYVAGGAYSPAIGDMYILSSATNVVALYRIVTIKRDADEMCEITAVEYFEELYEAADYTGNVGALTVPNYSLIVNPQRSSVTGVTVSSKIYQDTSGNWKVGVEVFYSPPANNSFWTGAILYYAKAGTVDYLTLPENSKGMFFVPDIAESGDYRFIVTSTYTSGKQTVDDALSDAIYHPWRTEHINVYVPNDSFLTGVQGLSIENRINDDTFVGKDCIVTWKRPIAIDAAVSATAGDEGYGAGVDTSGSWFRDYLILVKNMDGQLRRSSRITSERYIYTHEMNYEDGLVARTFTITVIAYDRLGRESAPQTVICSNPAPSTII